MQEARRSDPPGFFFGIAGWLCPAATVCSLPEGIVGASRDLFATLSPKAVFADHPRL
jgi:hypothetical protein